MACLFGSGIEGGREERILPVRARDLDALSHLEDLDLENRCQLGFQAVRTALQPSEPAMEKGELLVEMGQERLVRFASFPEIVSELFTLLAQKLHPGIQPTDSWSQQVFQEASQAG